MTCRTKTAAARVTACAQALAAIALGVIVSAGAAADAPSVYRQPFYESPVRAGSDDLLLIAGYGFRSDDRVVYRLDSGFLPGTHPSALPTTSDAGVGFAEVVSSADVPYSLTVRLPKVLREDETYELWVVTKSLEWSEPLRFNDPRPLWFSPSIAYATRPVAGLPRTIKIIGRNLESSSAHPLIVRLTGPVTLELAVESAGTTASDSEGETSRYAVGAHLPLSLPIGHYTVQVRRGRSRWITLPGQQLEVRPDPSARPELSVGAAEFGNCRADGVHDVSGCLVRAIAAAHAVGGGIVVLGPGRWRLSNRADPVDGILLPPGVALRGAGSTDTVLIFGADSPPLGEGAAVITLSGHNEIAGLSFVDEHRYAPSDPTGSFIRLGPLRSEGAQQESARAAIEDVTIEDNVFDRPNVAIAAGGAPMSRLFITRNDIGAYRNGLLLSGNRFLVNEKFDIQDSVIAFNVFEPGSYLDIAQRQGTIASELGAATRVDFSNNVADGTATRRLNSPADARGWRAAFFWHMNGNVEMMLVSNNVATCTGDKDGDGEAISYDNNANTFALSEAQRVLEADRYSVAVPGPLAMRQEQREIRAADYYVGHWIQVGDGPGLGQVRKIVSYEVDPTSGTARFRVEPAWDVVPEPGKSRISVGREYWQVYTIGNRVDERRPPCLKSNRTRPQAGVIGIWAQNADSVIAANRQLDSDGILFRQHYDAPGVGCAECRAETNYVDFLEVRGNVIEGEYNRDDGCSSSGIFGSLAAAPTSPPPVVGYGISISHNMIVRADRRRGGGISFVPTWYEGPSPQRWPLTDNPLIFHNVLRGFVGPAVKPCTEPRAMPRTAISLGAGHLVTHAVLYANECPDAQRALDAFAGEVTLVCDDRAACGCLEGGNRP